MSKLEILRERVEIAKKELEVEEARIKGECHHPFGNITLYSGVVEFRRNGGVEREIVCTCSLCKSRWVRVVAWY